MEESQDLMWMMKRKQNFKSPIEAVPYGIGAINSNNSWEEKAFAEDAARILGGCIWPPRSYSCHFCKREFRSAQALGGHMNVHRRDRARLKHHHNEEDLHSHHKNHFTTTSRVSSSWPSTICTQENCFQPNMSTYSTSIRKGNHMDFLKGVANERKQIFKGLNKNNFVETSLSMGQKLAYGDKAITYKRTKTSSLPCLNERCLSVKSAEFVIGIKPGIEDLDLELRLGKTQKV